MFNILKVKRAFFYVSCFFLICSCSNQLTGKELHQWVVNPSNELIKSIESAEHQWDIQYEPLDYMIAKSFKQKIPSQIEYDSVRKRKEGLQYFKIKIQSKIHGNIFKNDPLYRTDDSQVLDYFLNDFEYDLLLVDGKDTLLPKLYHFERNYGALNYNNVLVAFNASDDKDDKKMLLQDRIFGLGLKDITIKKEHLEKIPKLKTK